MRRATPAKRDPQLIHALARFIAGYRDAGHPPAEMQGAALAAFPGASRSDYAIGICEANRRERADTRNG